MPVRMFFDTEFIEDGKTIDLISIGLVCENKTLYLENKECDFLKASDWVKENVLIHLSNDGLSKTELASTIMSFVNDIWSRTTENLEFWAYYADYDWVALCQLYGTMMELPEGWPRYCKDIKQLADSIGNPKLPKKPNNQQHALSDAIWAKYSFEFLVSQGAKP